jgi:hypothetical protein
VLRAQSLIASDGYFALVFGGVVAAAPVGISAAHLRRGPSSFFFHPGNGVVSSIMAILVRLALSTIRRRQKVSPQVTRKNAQAVRTAAFPDAAPAPWTEPTLGSDREELVGTTVPILVPAELRRTEQRRPPLRPRSLSRPMSQHAVGPPTCPLAVVGAVEPREPIGLFGPPVRPPHRGAA